VIPIRAEGCSCETPGVRREINGLSGRLSPAASGDQG
jgi:hypothetical protein